MCLEVRNLIEDMFEVNHNFVAWGAVPKAPVSTWVEYILTVPSPQPGNSGSVFHPELIDAT